LKLQNRFGLPTEAAAVLTPRTVIAAFIMSVAAAVSASAQEVRTEYMTWMEIRDALSSGKSTIIIPTGGVEQHGAHMVTGKHDFIVAETARRIALKLGDALVAPVLAYVPEGDIEKKQGHMAYPGTISLTPQLYAQVLEKAAESFHAHGFKTIVLLGDHGDSIAAQRAVAGVLSQRWGAQGVRVVNAENYYGHNGGDEWLKAQGETPQQIGEHGGIRDTSELLAIYPAGVRMDKRVADKDGVSGDPSRATPERGQKLVEMKVDAAVAEIQAAKKAPPGANGTAQPSGFWSRLWLWLFG
jgi:creatinine amidohydrolase